jgi:hypothetical protein
LSREIDGKLYTVNRPDYGFAYSSRQGFLVIDVLSIIMMSPKSKLYEWLKPRINAPNFVQKLFTIATFTQSGRGNSKETDPDLDRICFLKSIYDNSLFYNRKQIRDWGEGLLRGKNSMLARILMTAHILDQRRFSNFDIQLAKKQIFDLLEIEPDSDQIKILFNQSGIYLNICGDVDMFINKSYHSDRFFILQHNPILLMELLNDSVYGLYTSLSSQQR